MNIADEVLELLGVGRRFSGGREVGLSSNGNSFLKLNVDYPLGQKGNCIEVPRDKEIYDSVRRRGQWGLEESLFLADGLKIICERSNSRNALLDIGANVGLISLQCCNLYSKGNYDVHLFEPIQTHATAIETNLKNVLKERYVQINQFALSDRTEKRPFFTEANNRGNTSIFKTAVPLANQIETEVSLIDTVEYFSNFNDLYNGFVIKCDTQGMDALILSRIPKVIWERIERAVIEVWALPEVSSKDVQNLMVNLNHFKFVGWSPSVNTVIDLEDVTDFWLNGSSESKNLYISR